MKIITFLITILLISLSNSSLHNEDNIIQFLSDSNEYDLNYNLNENTVTNNTYTETDDVYLTFEEIVNKKG